jgi:hypothetical protein
MIVARVAVATTGMNCVPASHALATIDSACNGRQFVMTDISSMPIGMMLGMGLIGLLVIVFLMLGIAAAIKYLRS